jgi:hypothetical protein
MKLDLLTNTTVVDDAIRFVSQKSKENLKPTCSSNDEDKMNQMSLTMMKTKINLRKSKKRKLER